jgi:hypothetical protein
MSRWTAVVMLVVLSWALAAPALAAEPPTLLARASGSVNINRGSNENPMIEIARSVFWGAVAGTAVGLAIAVADDSPGGEPVRWGFVVGTFVGLGAGIYFVSQRPQPESLLEWRDGRLTPGEAPFAALEPTPGGARVRALQWRF